MKVRFCTSVGGSSFSYMEGQTLDLPDPMPLRFLEWLRSGIVEPVRSLDEEVALAPPAVEQAVLRRESRQGRRGRGKVTRAEDD